MQREADEIKKKKYDKRPWTMDAFGGDFIFYGKCNKKKYVRPSNVESVCSWKEQNEPTHKKMERIEEILQP